MTHRASTFIQDDRIMSSDNGNLTQFMNSLNEQGLLKGHFKLLDSARIDLPTVNQSNHATVWMSHVVPSVQEKFSDIILTHLLSPIRCALTNTDPLPAARVHALPGHYPKMLLRLQNAGMLEWSHTDREPPQYRRFADAITMTSFAVYKDERKDRLISWPRVQNLYMPDPPYTALPNPGHFSKIRCDTETQLSGFCIEIQNMFQNIRLPSHIASAFPMTTVSFGSLPGDLQRSLQKELGYKPPQHARMRPLQTTLPMGFKWSLYIAHSFVQSCYNRVFQTFFSTFKTIQPSLPTPNVYVLHKSPGILLLEPANVLVLHVIDDLNFIFSGWPRDLIVSFQGILTSFLSHNNLPIHTLKSSPMGVVEFEYMPFIGWLWHLRHGIIRPKPEKLLATAAYVSTSAHSSINEESIRSAVGRLVWICLGSRPLLSILYRTFQYLQEPSRCTSSFRCAVRRELGMATNLGLYSCIKIRRKIWTRLIAFDACNTGGAVVYSDVTEENISNMIKISKLYESRPFLSPLSSAAYEDLKKDISYCRELISKISWKTAFVHHWRRPEHINALEAHTAILALNWATSFPITGFRILFLSDSLVTIDAFRKGRSSSPSLCLPCRRFATLCIAHDLDVFLLHVPSELNPADGPSRSRARAGSNGQRGLVPVLRLTLSDIIFEKQWKKSLVAQHGIVKKRTTVLSLQASMRLKSPQTASPKIPTPGLLPDQFFFTRHPLIAATLTNNTRTQYLAAYQTFRDSLRSIPSNPFDFDDTLSIYIEECFHDDPSPGNRQKMQSTVSFIILACPQFRGTFGLSRRALSGWHRLKPPKSALPLSRNIMFAFAAYFMRRKVKSAAVALALQWATYMRGSEILALSVSDIALPEDSRFREAGIHNGGVNIQKSKTGTSQFTPVRDSDVLALLRTFLARSAPRRNKTLFKISYQQYNKLFKEDATFVGLDSTRFTSHSARIWGALSDYCRGSGPKLLLLPGDGVLSPHLKGISEMAEHGSSACQ